MWAAETRVSAVFLWNFNALSNVYIHENIIFYRVLRKYLNCNPELRKQFARHKFREICKKQ
jgi:hypothetical protein